MPKYQLESPEALATAADLEKLNNSTPFPADVEKINENILAVRSSVGARLDSLEQVVNRSTRSHVITQCWLSIVLLILLGAIVYKLYSV